MREWLLAGDKVEVFRLKVHIGILRAKAIAGLWVVLTSLRPLARIEASCLGVFVLSALKFCHH